MADQIEPYQLTAQVKTAGEALTKKDKIYYKLELMEDDGRAFIWSCFDASGATAQAGKTYKFLVNRPPNTNGDHPSRNIVRVLGETDALPTTGDPAKTPTSPVQRSNGTGGSRGPSHDDQTRVSIERQTALKAAVEYCSQLGVSGISDITGDSAITIAENFYMWISGQAQPATQVARGAVPQTSGTSPEEVAAVRAVVAPDNLDAAGFAKLAGKVVGWSRAEVASYLGVSAAEWVAAKDGRTYNGAWKEAVEMYLFTKQNPMPVPSKETGVI